MSHPKNWFASQVYFLQHYPIKESLIQKWTVPVVDPAISCPSKILTVPVEDNFLFKDQADNILEVLFRALFLSQAQPCNLQLPPLQFVRPYANSQRPKLFMDSSIHQQLQFILVVLLYCVRLGGDALPELQGEPSLHPYAWDSLAQMLVSTTPMQETPRGSAICRRMSLSSLLG